MIKLQQAGIKCLDQSTSTNGIQAQIQLTYFSKLFAQQASFIKTQQLKPRTLVRLRWLAIGGQTLAVLFVAFALGFPLPITLCLTLIAISAVLNLLLTYRLLPARQLTVPVLSKVLAFDLVQLTCLLYLTGGLENPFSMLISVPTIMSSFAQPLRQSLILGIMTILAVIGLAFFHLPIPWYPGQSLFTPQILILATGLAIVATLIFTAVFVGRAADEARQLTTALNAMEQALWREQHLSALNGLAAAAAHELGTPLSTIALIAREMNSEADQQSLDADIETLRSQAARCRQILTDLAQSPEESSDHFAPHSPTALIEDVIEPIDCGVISVIQHCEGTSDCQPTRPFDPSLIYSLRNLIENAIEFASQRVEIHWRWDNSSVKLVIADDGPGFPPALLNRLGEPYTSERAGTHAMREGLGLGLFIATTLLERSGAKVTFSNTPPANTGARVHIVWSYRNFETPQNMS